MTAATAPSAQRIEGETAAAEEVKEEPPDDLGPLSGMMPVRPAVEKQPLMLQLPLRGSLPSAAAAAAAHQTEVPAADGQPAVKQEPRDGPPPPAGNPATLREEDGVIVITDSEDEEMQSNQGGNHPPPREGQEASEEEDEEDCEEGREEEDGQVSDPPGAALWSPSMLLEIYHVGDSAFLSTILGTPTRPGEGIMISIHPRGLPPCSATSRTDVITGRDREPQ